MTSNRAEPLLTGKVAIVTGVSRGIGRAICEAFLAAGARVFGTSRTSPAVSGLRWIEADMSAASAPAPLVECALAEAGRIDVVVNNVGGLAEPHDPNRDWGHALGASADITDEVWQRTMTLNLYAPVRVIRAATPELIRRKGSIINISSVAAVAPDPTIIDYCAAKAALNAYTSGIARELGPHGVRANTVSLGAFLTSGWTDPGTSETAWPRKPAVSTKRHVRA